MVDRVDSSSNWQRHPETSNFIVTYQHPKNQCPNSGKTHTIGLRGLSEAEVMTAVIKEPEKYNNFSCDDCDLFYTPISVAPVRTNK